jgi:hypothetical protein
MPYRQLQSDRRPHRKTLVLRHVPQHLISFSFRVQVIE